MSRHDLHMFSQMGFCFCLHPWGFANYLEVISPMLKCMHSGIHKLVREANKHNHLLNVQGKRSPQMRILMMLLLCLFFLLFENKLHRSGVNKEDFLKLLEDAKDFLCYLSSPPSSTMSLSPYLQHLSLSE